MQIGKAQVQSRLRGGLSWPAARLVGGPGARVKPAVAAAAAKMAATLDNDDRHSPAAEENTTNRCYHQAAHTHINLIDLQ